MVAWLLALALLRADPSLQPIGLGGAKAPSAYRLDGYLDKAPEGATVYFRPLIGVGEQQRLYLITSYQRQGDGNPFDLFRNLGMYKPDFILLGPKKLLGALISAPPGSRVRGTFYFRRASHVLEVDSHSLTVE